MYHNRNRYNRYGNNYRRRQPIGGSRALNYAGVLPRFLFIPGEARESSSEGKDYKTYGNVNLSFTIVSQNGQIVERYFYMEVADMETLAMEPGMVDKHRMPQEFYIVNEATGKSIRFEFERVEMHGSGEDAEVGAWIFKAVDGNSFPVKLHILND